MRGKEIEMAEASKRASGAPTVVDEALGKAMEALESHDWGSDLAALEAVDKAVSSSQPGEQKELETRLAAVLKSNAPRAAKDYVCRKLAWIGTARSVPALAALLANKDLAHMARYALERIGGAEAGKALRDALPKVEGGVKIGVVNSLGARRDSRSASQLAALLNAPAPETAAAAAFALGRIGGAEAARALAQYRRKAPKEYRLAAADACMECARRLLAHGNREEALAIFRDLCAEDQPDHVRLAAKHAMSAADRV
jgi:HEAT repeat protein